MPTIARIDDFFDTPATLTGCNSDSSAADAQDAIVPYIHPAVKQLIFQVAMDDIGLKKKIKVTK